jgi:hypothetical protein
VKRHHVFWLFLLAILTACVQVRESGPTPHPDMDVVDDPEEIEPPPAILTVAGQEQVSGIGSFCWSGNAREGGQVHLCVDTVGLPTAPEPLAVSGSFTVTFRLPIAEQPQELSLRIIPVTDQDQLDVGSAPWRWWPGRAGTRRVLPLTQEPGLALSLDPGLYLLSLFARWPERGDVAYGFLVEAGRTFED